MDERKTGKGIKIFAGILVILLVAVLTGVLGFLLLVRPFEAAEVMMILVGVSILFEGILNLCVSIYTVKIIKNQKQDIIDMDEY